MDRLAYLPSLAENFQVELVRAARAYASGLWWANEDPNRAWLQLVTAVEVAAKARQVGNPTSREYTPLARCRDQRCQTHELRTEPLSTGPRLARLLAPTHGFSGCRDLRRKFGSIDQAHEGAVGDPVPAFEQLLNEPK